MVKKFLAVFLLILIFFGGTVSDASAKKSKKITYKNGDISNNIIINEIFPRAKKDDRNNEWIELYNTGSRDIKLGNWQLDDNEGGSKPYKFSDKIIIKAGGFLVVSAKQSKLSLGNEKDTVRLFDYKSKLIDSVEYNQAPIQKSYLRAMIHKEEGVNEQQWLFDEHLTPGEKNPEYYEINGTVKKEPVFEEKHYFIFENLAKKEIKITFSEGLIPGPLAKVTFVKDTKAKLLITQYQQNDKDKVAPPMQGVLLPRQSEALNFLAPPQTLAPLQTEVTPQTELVRPRRTGSLPAEIFELKKYEITSSPKINRANTFSIIWIIGIVFIALASIILIMIFKKSE